MTDKFKDQDSMLPAASSSKTALSKKPAKSGQVIINPPEKVDPQRGFNERFQALRAKHSVVLEKKTELVLQSKATRSDFPQDVIEQVYKRGFKALPLNTELTREQYAMNRVNSFIAGGAAMVEDYDLLPITERVHTRIGMKGTGGGARPHIKREKSPYNGKTVFHVVDAKGIVKHSTGDEFEAKKHLASKYNAYLGESLAIAGAVVGAAALGRARQKIKDWKAKKAQQAVKEETLSELNKDTLISYVKKVAKDAMKHRMDPTKRSPEKASKSVSGFSKALNRLPAPKEPFFKESAICSVCQADPCICDESHGFVGEARMSASERFSRAFDKQRAKSDASLRRTPSSIPKPEPKKEESK